MDDGGQDEVGVLGYHRARWPCGHGVWGTENMSVDVEHSTHPLNETRVRIRGAMMKKRE